MLKKYSELTSVMGLVEQGQLDATVARRADRHPLRPRFPRPAHASASRSRRATTSPTSAKATSRSACALNAAIESAIADGTLERLYKKYGIWNDDQLQLADVAKNWPPAAAAAESRWANLGHYTGMLLRAAWTTIQLSFLSMPLAIAARPRGRRRPALRSRVDPHCRCEAYVELLRGTPLLLQLFVIYYVLPQLTGVSLPEFWAGVLGLAINYSAYEAENYRAGLLAIPRGQMEAALALGMNTRTALRRVIIPQAVRIVIPPVTNDFIALFKDTQRLLDDRRRRAHRHVPLPVPEPPATDARVRRDDRPALPRHELPALARRPPHGNALQTRHHLNISGGACSAR